MDWDHFRTFLYIARHGSLSGAARQLAVSQTTVARRLAAFEQGAGCKLFDRRPEGFALTRAGDRLMTLAEEMEVQALAAERAITREDIRLGGLVRIATVDIFAAWFITPALGAMQEKYPNISVELLTGPGVISLARREADIAIRTSHFESDAITRRVAHMAWGLYGSEAYFAKHGELDFSNGGAGHQVLGAQEDRANSPESVWLRETIPAARQYLLANSWSVRLSACKEGLGLALLPRYAADVDPTLRLLPAPTTPPGRDIWIGVHRDLRDTPRIREVLDFLTVALKDQATRLRGVHIAGPPTAAEPAFVPPSEMGSLLPH